MNTDLAAGMTLGYCRIDEELFPVTSVVLIPGGFRVTIHSDGPKPACSGPYRLFTGAGDPVTDPADGDVGYASVPELSADQTFTMDIKVLLNHIKGKDARIRHKTW